MRRIYRRMCIPAVIAVLVQACRVGPNYHVPTLPDGAGSPLVSIDTKAESPLDLPDAWWQLYNDAKLDELIREALQANRSLAAADANFAASRALLLGAHAARYPTTEVAAGGVYGRDPITDEILELGGHSPQTLWLFEGVFQAAYEVDLFGRVHRSIEAANANADAVLATRDSVRVVVVAETARAYAAVCALGQQLMVAQHSFEVVSHEADIALRRHEAGANSEFDVRRANAFAAQVKAAIPQIEGARRIALFELTALLGRTPVNAPTNLDSCVNAPQLNAPIPVGDGAALIRRRPDVRAAERRLAAATAQIGITTAELYPIVRLTGFYGGAAPEISELNTTIGRIWGVGPSISWNFPNQSGARARVRQATASQAAALANFDAVVLTALKEVEQALARYGAAMQNRQSLLVAQKEIHGSFDIAHDGYLAGSLSSLELLTTEQSLVTLDASIASSDSTLVEDQIGLFKALGGGWSAASLDKR